MRALDRSVLAASVLAVSCVPGSPGPGVIPSGNVAVRMLVPDFRSSFESGGYRTAYASLPGPGLCVGRGQDFGEALRSADPHALAAAGTTLTRVEDGRRIDGELRHGVDIDGNDFLSFPVGYDDLLCFVPDAALVEGWYVFRMDLRSWQGLGTNIGGLPDDGALYARIRIGSEPIWFATQFNCRPDFEQPSGPPIDECRLTGFVSEEVPSWGSSMIEVRFDGSLVECTPYFPDGERGFGATCPYAELGSEIEVRLTSDVVTDLEGNHDRRHSTVLTRGSWDGVTLQLSPRFGLDVAEAP